jgi:hypothetical protein
MIQAHRDLLPAGTGIAGTVGRRIGDRKRFDGVLHR